LRPAKEQGNPEEIVAREENIDALKRAAERFRARDLEGHLAIYDSAVVHHGFSSRIRPGISGLRDHYTGLLQGFPDMRIDVEDIIADNEKVVHRFTFYGTHRGEFQGMAATMKLVITTGVHIHLFKSGKCIEVWQVLDTFRFLSQVGAVSPLRQTR
jgi:predicted ester cyclase